MKDEESSLVDIVHGIQSDHLLLCLCQMSAKLMDFVFFYNQLIHLHEEEVRSGEKDGNMVHYYSPVHNTLPSSSVLTSTSDVEFNELHKTENNHNNNDNDNDREGVEP